MLVIIVDVVSIVIIIITKWGQQKQTHCPPQFLDGAPGGGAGFSVGLFPLQDQLFVRCLDPVQPHAQEGQLLIHLSVSSTV